MTTNSEQQQQQQKQQNQQQKSFEEQVREYYETRVDLDSFPMPVITSEMPEKRDVREEANKEGGESKEKEEPKAKIQHHQANPGPVMMAENIGEPASKEELKARAAELNKQSS